MILKKISLKNFRQFTGEQHICFSGESEDGKPVTLIFGENGRGKTGVFRALIFCLFGERELSQDGQIESKELKLVNTSALEQSRLAGNAPVEAYVELEFSHRGEFYQLRRSLLGVLEGEEIIEELKEVKLGIRDENGNWQKQTNPREIEQIIDAILDKRIKEYFLFDGEKIERLTRASHDQRKEVAKGIRTLLNIDALEEAVKATRRLNRNLDRELAGRSTGEMPRLIKELEDNSNRRATLGSEKETLEEELDLAEQEKRHLDGRLEKYREIRHLHEQRKELERQIADIESALQEMKINLRSRTGRNALLLCEDVVKTVCDNLESRKRKGEIPPQIRKELIDKMLEDGRCICGNSLEPGTDSLRCILEWQNRVCESDLQDSAVDLWRHLSAVLARSGELADTLEVDLQRYAVAKNELDRLKSKRADIGTQIGTSGRRDAAELESHRLEVEKKIIKKKAEFAVKEQDLQSLDQAYKKLVERRRELLRQKGLMDAMESRAQLALDTSEALEAVRKEFTSEVRERIGARATELFTTLLDKESQASLSAVVVTEDYSLQVLDRWKKTFLSNISAGQRQIMSISFIAALAETAAGGIALEMPFFMDTPFGRLSFQHRKNLIRCIPTLCSQWILLATDTEFTQREAKLLRASGHWGRFYVLRGTTDGSTRIAEMKPEEALAILRHSEEDEE